MKLTTEDTDASVNERLLKKDNLKRNQAIGGARNDNTRKCVLTKSETVAGTSR